MNNRQDEQGDRGGTARQPVDRADNERAKGLVKSQAPEAAIEPGRWDRVRRVTVLFGIMAMGVAVDVVAVPMDVLMSILCFRGHTLDRAHRGAEV